MFDHKGFEILSGGELKQSKKKYQCEHRGEGFSCDITLNRHLNGRKCVILKALDYLITRFEESFINCHALIKRLIHLLADKFEKIHALRDFVGEEENSAIRLERLLQNSGIDTTAPPKVICVQCGNEFKTSNGCKQHTVSNHFIIDQALKILSAGEVKQSKKKYQCDIVPTELQDSQGHEMLNQSLQLKPRELHQLHLECQRSHSFSFN